MGNVKAIRRWGLRSLVAVIGGALCGSFQQGFSQTWTGNAAATDMALKCLDPLFFNTPAVRPLCDAAKLHVHTWPLLGGFSRVLSDVYWVITMVYGDFVLSLLNSLAGILVLIVVFTLLGFSGFYWILEMIKTRRERSHLDEINRRMRDWSPRNMGPTQLVLHSPVQPRIAYTRESEYA